MKNILFAGTFIILLLNACKSETKETPKDEPITSSETAEVIEVDPFPNYTNLDLDEAFVSFSEGDNDLAASYIRTAISDLRQTEYPPAGEGSALMDKIVSDLEKLAEEVESGQVKDRKTLENIFAEVDMNGAMVYMILAQENGKDHPEHAKSALRNAVTRMEKASSRLEGEAKTDLDHILNATRDFLKKEDIKANDWGNTTGHRIMEITNWKGIYGHEHQS